MVEKRGSIVPFSIRVTDCFDTPARSANSPCDQFSRPREALILAAKMMLDGIYLTIACLADDGWVVKTSPPFVVKDGPVCVV
jgi:hypothetical protein